MAGTSILATICAERLTKFLTRYSKAQTGSVRSNIPVDSLKPNTVPPTARVSPDERKYSLWQPAEYQFQMPILERPRSLDPIYGYTIGRYQHHLRMVNVGSRLKVGTTGRIKLMSARRTSMASYNGSPKSSNGCSKLSRLSHQTLSQVLAQTTAQLAKYASNLLTSKSARS